MIEFKKTIDPENKFCVSEVSFKIHDEASLPELLTEFGNFLKACGFVFDGEVDIVDNDADYAHLLTACEEEFGQTTS